MTILKPFQLLEINVISAQDLEHVSKKMRTYATAWVQPKRKLSTRVDVEGYNNPTWNDKFVFRVDDEFLRLDTAAVMIEIYANHWLRDTLVGTVRVLVGNIFPPAARTHHHHHFGMRFVALQVRRPSGRPQGILNIGVTLLDGSMRSMPLYTQLSASAVGFQDLMGEEDRHHHHHHHQHQHQHQPEHEQNNNHGTIQPPNVKPILRRSRSERVTFDNVSIANSSMVTIPQDKGTLTHTKASSIISISEFGESLKWSTTKKGKASSVISGAELLDKPIQKKGPKGKASSVISGSVVSTTKDPPKFNEKPKPKLSDSDEEKEKPNPVTTSTGPEIGRQEKVIISKPAAATIGKPISNKLIPGPPQKANSILSDSEVGPPPSEVAAAIMAQNKYPLEEDGSSVLDGWSLDESVEGLRSKLERWRTELPPIYDRGGYSTSSFRSSNQQRTRRHSDGGSGLFSCFGNIYGYECQCICGKPTVKKTHNKNRFQSPSSIASGAGRSFL